MGFLKKWFGGAGKSLGKGATSEMQPMINEISLASLRLGEDIRTAVFAISDSLGNMGIEVNPEQYHKFLQKVDALRTLVQDVSNEMNLTVRTKVDLLVEAATRWGIVFSRESAAWRDVSQELLKLLEEFSNHSGNAIHMVDTRSRAWENIFHEFKYILVLVFIFAVYHLVSERHKQLESTLSFFFAWRNCCLSLL
jgi:hypothetical protein